MPAGGEEAAGQAQQMVPHRVGDPGIDTVGNDVVEWAQAGVQVEDVALSQFQVTQAQGLDQVLAHGDLPRREVDAQAPGAGQTLGQGDEIAAPGAANLQHPGGRGGCCV